MISSWADAKRYLAEDILLYSGIIILDLMWDVVLNLAIAINLYAPAHETYHPYQFGIGQIGLLFFAALQITRKLKDWQYWR